MRSLANAEMYLAIPALFGRYDLELYDTTRERDVDTSRDCFTGEATKISKGMRVTVSKELTAWHR